MTPSPMSILVVRLLKIGRQGEFEGTAMYCLKFLTTLHRYSTHHAF